ncbi:putative zinc metalloprotease Rip3 [Sporotomaculum syntrophicum]|uniref:Zinc metalloprotease Rip3 n=1 Tax=Sporotomaculum syntrophicum TaxID=182264 RepID=A0A9D3AY29_9FIRM|nr:M50 family metallopeptidase [Sporotomaculum syntrophicum]KAF1085617.1 putative zinc metalloprotease Rip3 [Sporotomaculum syntrophicum]
MRLGRILGVDIYLNPFFLALLALFFVAGVLDRGLVAFGVVLVHEMAHSLMANRLGIPAHEVELLPFGGVARAGTELQVDPVRETYTALAGPVSNLAMIAFAIALKNYGLWHADLGPFFLQCNLLMAFFNLLPALPLDGGRIYRSYLAARIGITPATYRAARLGQVFAVIIAVFSVLGVWWGACGVDILVTALFLFYAATRERSAAPYLFMQLLMRKHQELLREGVLPVKQLVAIENVPLGQLMQSFLPRRFHLVTVLDKQSQYLGTVTESSIIDSLMHRGSNVPVGELIER